MATKEINFTPFPILATERLILRQMEETDDVAILFLRSDTGVTKYIDRAKYSGIADARAFIARINNDIKNNKVIFWAIGLKSDSGLIGTICLWNFSADRRTAELGYDLHPDHQGKGIMNEAFQPVIHFAFETGFKTLEAFTHRDNRRSIKLLLKNNFVHDPSRKDEDHVNNSIFIFTEAV